MHMFRAFLGLLRSTNFSSAPKFLCQTYLAPQTPVQEKKRSAPCFLRSFSGVLQKFYFYTLWSCVEITSNTTHDASRFAGKKKKKTPTPSPARRLFLLEAAASFRSHFRVAAILGCRRHRPFEVPCRPRPCRQNEPPALPATSSAVPSLGRGCARVWCRCPCVSVAGGCGRRRRRSCPRAPRMQGCGATTRAASLL